MKLLSAFVLALLCAAPVHAQNEGAIHSEFRQEGEKVQESCSGWAVKKVGACAVTLATEHPLHIAFGSIAPQSGLGFGAALVGHHTPNRNWRLSWNGDGVATPGGSWRTGVYLKAVRTGVRAPQVVPGGIPVAASPPDRGAYPVFTVFAQSASLKNLRFYGIGPSAPEAGEAAWDFKETIVGGDVLLPVKSGSAGVSLIGGVTGRFVDVGQSSTDSAPSIGQLYTDATAPGLTQQPRYTQVTGGAIMRPFWLNGRVQPTYLFTLDKFVATSGSSASFWRWNLDVAHVVPLYRTTRPSVTANGPDDCAQSVDSTTCPSPSRNRDGSVGVRFLTTASAAGAGGAVPFYFQPTLGGSDINGMPILSSFADYRFRAPNRIALQESFDHSLPWWALGFVVMAEQGKVAVNRSDLNLSGLVHSYAAGLTVRAGGFPQITLLFAWGNEGHHIGATVNPSLLGGAARPSFY